MRCFWLALILASSLCSAAPHCPDPKLRQAIIGGRTITGHVVLHRKPLRSAPMRLYSSSGKTVWTGSTGKNGEFNIAKMPRDNYRLAVHGWGNGIVQLNPELDKGFHGQIPVWSLLLIDNSCVDTIMVLN